MPDEASAGTGGPEGSSAAGATAASGTAAATGASSATGDGTDYKAKFEELQKQYEKVTGKAGATQSTLTEQLTAATARADAAEAQAKAHQRALFHRDVLDEVLAKAPEKSRNAIRLVADGILPSLTETDPTKAAEAVIAKITASAPELLKPSSVVAVPHATNGTDQRPSFGITSASGKRLI